MWLISTANIIAQTVINGTAKSHIGHTVELVMYTDYFTYKQQVIASSTIDSSGTFEFDRQLTSSSFYMLKIGSSLGGIYLEKDASYNVVFPETDTLSTFYFNREHYVNLEINEEDSMGTNHLITLFNKEYDDFMSDNITLFVRRIAKQKTDTFCSKISAKFSSYERPYLNDYVDYNIAMLKFSAMGRNTRLYQDFFKNRPILYNNDAYMEFVNLFYKDYFKTLPINLYDELIKAVKIEMNQEHILRLMHSSKFLENDALKELILIKSLYENFQNPDFSKKSILFLLKQIMNTTDIEEHKKIANNVLIKLSGIEKGSYAPDFTLINGEGDSVKLSSLYKSNYVYLDFWATWCKSCIRDIKIMNQLHDAYGHHIQFVSISIDKKFKLMKRFLSKHKYEWTFLHYGNNESLINEYHVSLPLNYLIGPGGKILQSPAGRPNEIKPELEKIHQLLLPKTKSFER